jgi:hypothetical protein
MAGLVPNDWPHSSYATHFHALLDVMVCFGPKRVLETGSGYYSTGFFLSFNIEKLVSIENDREWVRNYDDPRHRVIQPKGPIAENLPDLGGFDLVFVDDDPVDGRAETLKAVLAKAPGLVVVHDSDDGRLHKYIGGRPNHTDFHQPNTTVVCPSRSKEFAEWLATR